MDPLNLNQKIDFIYYYPTEGGSPNNVSRNLFKYLLLYQNYLPFENIKIFCKKKNVQKIKEQFPHLEVLTYWDLKKISSNSLIHIPILPTILPNSKFLLYIYCLLNKKTQFILQYHGDVRTELRSSYKDFVSLIHILTYIFIPKILQSADFVITHSYYMKRIIQDYNVKNIFVIPNAIEPYWFEDSIKDIPINQLINKNKFNIFYHGRLSWEKGVDLLIEALGFYIKKNKEVVLYLAGEGPQKKELREISSKMGLDNSVIFLGNLDKDNINYFLKNSDLAIYPSRFDNFPLSILEALACSKCPVYFSKNTGISEFLPQEKIGLNVFELSTQNIVRILEEVDIGNSINSSLSIQKDFAKKFLWDSVIFQYLNVYVNLLKTRNIHTSEDERL
ncbi:glycosyltransferase family 4 protein [Methanosarcina mazei]|uniref:Glycosyltransferase n=1 Tax=Methanosarcina mazei LYC TaxID=1434114 RepID=A0A0E3RTW9_METMZ|nr:glycosyltransferase family 4 protein [Methanosarcina mazei]AKB69082.1 Glycosyltransferase [Methanosarcina mazei LYC]